MVGPQSTCESFHGLTRSRSTSLYESGHTMHYGQTFGKLTELPGEEFFSTILLMDQIGSDGSLPSATPFHSGLKLGGEISNLLLTEVAWQDHPGPTNLRPDKFPVHRLDCFPELLAHRGRGASTPAQIASQPPPQPRSGWTIQKNPHIEKPPQRGSAQK